MKIFLLTIICFLSSISLSSQDINFDSLELEFKADTARIEQYVRNSKESSTVGIINTSNYMEEEYDNLLNKYYKILYNSLDAEGKRALKQTQRNWIKLRDSDKALISELRAKAYKDAGGGTVWGVVASGARVNITKERVFQIYNFLLFSDLGGR